MISISQGRRSCLDAPRTGAGPCLGFRPQLAGDLRGRLRIAAPLSFGPTHFATVFAEMAQRHPHLHIHTCYSDRFVDIVAEGYDCAIRLGHLQDSNLIARRVGPIHGRLVATPGYVKLHGAPETPAELLTHQTVMQGTEAWQFMDGEKVITIHPQGRFKADNGTALVAAALAGLGIADLPEGLVAEHLASGALVSVMTRHPIRPAGIFVVHPPGQNPAWKVRVLTEMLIECFGKEKEVAGTPQLDERALAPSETSTRIAAEASATGYGRESPA